MHTNTVLGEATATPSKSSALAISSLICGIMSCLGCIVLTGIPAIVCGHMAKSRIKQSEGKITGSGMATAGLILGYFSLVLTLAALLLAPIIINSTGVVELTKDTISLQTLVEPLNRYEAEFGKFPDSLDELKYPAAKEKEWIYFSGQSSKSNGSNILIASPPHNNGVTVILNVDGTVKALQKAQYEAAKAAQQ